MNGSLTKAIYGKVGKTESEQPDDQARVWDASSWQHLDQWERVKRSSVDCEPLRRSMFNPRTFFSEMDASWTTSFKALDSKVSVFSGIRPRLTVEHLVHPYCPHEDEARALQGTVQSVLEHFQRARIRFWSGGKEEMGEVGQTASRGTMDSHGSRIHRSHHPLRWLSWKNMLIMSWFTQPKSTGGLLLLFWGRKGMTPVILNIIL